MDPDSAVVASQVRAEIARRHIKPPEYHQLAERIGMSESSFRRRYNGSITWRADELIRLARDLGVPSSRFFPNERAA